MFDLQQLRAYKDAGDRVGYYTYLSQFDRYGTLALGVVTNETREGYIANVYFSEIYKQKTGAYPTADLMRSIGIGLMNADYETRFEAIRNGNTGLNLDAKTYKDYHESVFKNETNQQVGIEAWTAWEPLKNALTTGDMLRANNIFNLMMSDRFFDQMRVGTGVGNTPPLELFPESFGPNMSAGSWFSWAIVVGPALARYQSSETASISYRNTELINGWSRNAETGEWTRPSIVDLFLSGPDDIRFQNQAETASLEVKAALDQERTARINHYKTSAISDPQVEGSLYASGDAVYKISADGRAIEKWDEKDGVETHEKIALTETSAGRKIAYSFEDEDGSTKTIDRVVDPTTGRLKSLDVESYNAETGQTLEISKTYGANGALATHEETLTRNDGSETHTVYDVNGVPGVRYDFTPDPSGDGSGIQYELRADNTLIKRFYDANGNLVGEPETVSDGTQTYEKAFETFSAFASFTQAVVSGRPLPIGATGFSLIGKLTRNSQLMGVGSVLGFVSSASSLIKAIEKGDIAESIVSGVPLAQNRPFNRMSRRHSNRIRVRTKNHAAIVSQEFMQVLSRRAFS